MFNKSIHVFVFLTRFYTFLSTQGGFEPLDIAVQQGHVDVVTMLLEKDAKHGMKAMHQAAKKDDKSALKLLINDGKHSVNVRAPVS